LAEGKECVDGAGIRLLALELHDDILLAMSCLPPNTTLGALKQIEQQII
jgi:hypothetical protein